MNETNENMALALLLGVVFIYIVLDKSKANLAMARHQLTAIERDLVI